MLLAKQVCQGLDEAGGADRDEQGVARQLLLRRNLSELAHDEIQIGLDSGEVG
jgi:hypothetical protein